MAFGIRTAVHVSEQETFNHHKRPPVIPFLHSSLGDPRISLLCTPLIHAVTVGTRQGSGVGLPRHRSNARERLAITGGP